MGVILSAIVPVSLVTMVVAVVAVVVAVKRRQKGRGKRQGPDYNGFFIMGIVWFPLGLLWTITLHRARTASHRLLALHRCRARVPHPRAYESQQVGHEDEEEEETISQDNVTLTRHSVVLRRTVARVRQPLHGVRSRDTTIMDGCCPRCV